MSVYYHATDFKNLISISENGIHTGIDGSIYLCKNRIDCIKFIGIRGIKNILVLEVELNDDYVQESFDHSIEFFNCKAYTTNQNIQPSQIKNYYKYEL